MGWISGKMCLKYAECLFQISPQNVGEMFIQMCDDPK